MDHRGITNIDPAMNSIAEINNIAPGPVAGPEPVVQAIDNALSSVDPSPVVGQDVAMEAVAIADTFVVFPGTETSMTEEQQKHFVAMGEKFQTEVIDPLFMAVNGKALTQEEMAVQEKGWLDCANGDMKLDAVRTKRDLIKLYLMNIGRGLLPEQDVKCPLALDRYFRMGGMVYQAIFDAMAANSAYNAALDTATAEVVTDAQGKKSLVVRPNKKPWQEEVFLATALKELGPELFKKCVDKKVPAAKAPDFAMLFAAVKYKVLYSAADISRAFYQCFPELAHFEEDDVSLDLMAHLFTHVEGLKQDLSYLIASKKGMPYMEQVASKDGKDKVMTMRFLSFNQVMVAQACPLSDFRLVGACVKCILDRIREWSRLREASTWTEVLTSAESAEVLQQRFALAAEAHASAVEGTFNTVLWETQCSLRLPYTTKKSMSVVSLAGFGQKKNTLGALTIAAWAAIFGDSLGAVSPEALAAAGGNKRSREMMLYEFLVDPQANTAAMVKALNKKKDERTVEDLKRVYVFERFFEAHIRKGFNAKQLFSLLTKSAVRMGLTHGYEENPNIIEFLHEHTSALVAKKAEPPYESFMIEWDEKMDIARQNGCKRNRSRSAAGARAAATIQKPFSEMSKEEQREHTKQEMARGKGKLPPQCHANTKAQKRDRQDSSSEDMSSDDEPTSSKQAPKKQLPAKKRCLAKAPHRALSALRVQESDDELDEEDMGSTSSAVHLSAAVAKTPQLKDVVILIDSEDEAVSSKTAQTSRQIKLEEEEEEPVSSKKMAQAPRLIDLEEVKEGPVSSKKMAQPPSMDTAAGDADSEAEASSDDDDIPLGRRMNWSRKSLLEDNNDEPSDAAPEEELADAFEADMDSKAEQQEARDAEKERERVANLNAELAKADMVALEAGIAAKEEEARLKEVIRQEKQRKREEELKEAGDHAYKPGKQLSKKKAAKKGAVKGAIKKAGKKSGKKGDGK